MQLDETEVKGSVIGARARSRSSRPSPPHDHMCCGEVVRNSSQSFFRLPLTTLSAVASWPVGTTRPMGPPVEATTPDATFAGAGDAVGVLEATTERMMFQMSPATQTYGSCRSGST